MGKLSKMAKGKMQTHAADSEVDMGFLASLAPELGGSAALLEDIRAANTARHVLDLCREAGLRDHRARVPQGRGALHPPCTRGIGGMGLPRGFRRRSARALPGGGFMKDMRVVFYPP